MTIDDIIKSFSDENHPARKNPERLKFFRELCQDTLKIQIELNTKYNTPEEIIEIMSRLTRKKIDPRLNRKNNYAPIKICNNVWIGSNHCWRCPSEIY